MSGPAAAAVACELAGLGQRLEHRKRVHKFAGGSQSRYGNSAADDPCRSTAAVLLGSEPGTSNNVEDLTGGTEWREGNCGGWRGSLPPGCRSWNGKAVVEAKKDYLFALKNEHRTMLKLATELLSAQEMVAQTVDGLDN